MNCRSRAEGLARRLQTGLCATLGPAGAPAGAPPLDQVLLHNQAYEDPDHYAVISYRKASLCDSGDPLDLQPLHVVTSEPSLHLCLAKATREPSAAELLLPKHELDSDSFYDFGVDSPNEGEPEKSKDTPKGVHSEELNGEGDRSESGCVTQITSPDLCPFNLNNGHCDGQGGAPPDLIPRIPDIDLQEVSQILSSSSHYESNNGSCDESRANTTPSPISLSYHEDNYEKLIPTPCHTPCSPRGRLSPFPDCGYEKLTPTPYSPQGRVSPLLDCGYEKLTPTPYSPQGRASPLLGCGYEKLTPTPYSPQGRVSPLLDCGYVSPSMDGNKNVSSPAAVATAASVATGESRDSTATSAGAATCGAGSGNCISCPGGGALSPPPPPPGGRLSSVSPRLAVAGTGACWCHTQQQGSSDNTVVPNNNCDCNNGDVDINEYCICDEDSNQSVDDSDKSDSGHSGHGLLMAEAIGRPNVIQGQTSDKCENDKTDENIVSSVSEESGVDSVTTRINSGVLATESTNERSCGCSEGVVGSTGVSEVKETGGGWVSPPPVSPPTTISNGITLHTSIIPPNITKNVPNMNSCHEQTERPCDKVNDDDIVDQVEDQEESITTLSEDEVREAEDEDNDEDIEEEAIITGKFRNILGYQERVRRISEDENPTAPAIPGLPTFNIKNSSSSKPVLQIKDPCGINISVSEPHKPMESSNPNLDISIPSLDSENKISYGGFRKYSSKRRTSKEEDKEPEPPSSGSVTPIGMSSLEFISSLDVPECHFDIHTPPLPPNTLPPPSEISPDEESSDTEAISELEPEYYENLPEHKEDPTLVVKKSALDMEELTEELEQLKAEDNTDDEDIPDISIEVEPPSNQTSRETSEEPDSEKIEAYRNSMKRSSSLKYTKTPPGTPGSKKIVKFADVLGLDLADVRTFVEGIPHIPKSAFWDLPDKDKEEDISLTFASKTVPSVLPPLRILSPLFRNPVEIVEFPTILEKQKVCLESVLVGNDLSVKGVVRVLNLAFDKRIIVRYTFDQWKNIHEATATYIPGSSTGDTDQFSFMLWGSFLQDNGTLVFCVRYQTMGMEFWDSNRGSNYTLHCSTPPSTPSTQQQPEPCNDELAYKKVEKDSILRKYSDESKQQRKEAEELKNTLELLKKNSEATLKVTTLETTPTLNDKTNEQLTKKERQPFSRRKRLNKPARDISLDLIPTPFSY